MTPREGRIIDGKYQLERELASGGMGSVWVARHRKLDVRVAVKFMDPALHRDADPRARFEREAKAAAQLRSPHVVQVLDYGHETDTPYIVMELLEGEDLRARLKRVKRMTLVQAGTILSQACKALQLAHDAGIVHRDLKPDNVFLAKSGREEIVKLLDFGIAKDVRPPVGSDATKSGIVLGSPRHMSPEQARGLPDVDHRSDLWSMATLMFRMVTGGRPFRGDDPIDVVMKICSDPLPVPSALCPELPPEIDRFFVRGFARDRGERFQSAEEMAEAFARIAERYPKLALPPLAVATDGAAEPSGETSSKALLLPAHPPSEPSRSRDDRLGRAPPAGDRTLTAATTSLRRRIPMRRWRGLFALGAALLLGVGAWAAWRGGLAPSPSAEPDGSPPSASRAAAPSLPSLGTPPSPVASDAATTPADATSADAASAPSTRALGTPAARPAPPRAISPRAQPKRKPPPTSAPPPTALPGEHPVLGI